MIAVADRLPGIVGMYRVFTGNNEYPDEFDIFFDGFAFAWMNDAITHWWVA